ncbi:hypothetical protein BDZ90DRAFT_128057 [Jaminaea rosea]|uniref:Uncharacterized protein n=1 Tax=Jaminaea rosea TaxID=1569628 RepID=A0A316UGF8_9BASI|nr:hypothetical protein BDZ90DRAFT_128057 [Jaminaea rosea]PWN24346.1 hypothetical protein BDZ90DRAFT_128057 [Jaminaea rosea]
MVSLGRDSLQTRPGGTESLQLQVALLGSETADSLRTTHNLALRRQIAMLVRVHLTLILHSGPRIRDVLRLRNRPRRHRLCRYGSMHCGCHSLCVHRKSPNGHTRYSLHPQVVAADRCERIASHVVDEHEICLRRFRSTVPPNSDRRFDSSDISACRWGRDTI